MHRLVSKLDCGARVLAPASRAAMMGIRRQGRPAMSSWSDSVIWWQVYPLGFRRCGEAALPAGSPVQHRLPQLLGWLDYLIELGCNGLALNPVFASESHGYDIVDHFAVDARLGDDADIDQLIAACHDRGIRVLFDGVFNHVGRGFPGFADVIATGPGFGLGRLVPHRLGRPPRTTGSATGRSRGTAAWSRSITTRRPLRTTWWP